MKLTTIQVAERLSLSRGQVLNLVKKGLLPPLNGPKEGKKKFFPIIDSQVVDAYRKEHGRGNGLRKARRALVPSLPFKATSTPDLNPIARVRDTDPPPNSVSPFLETLRRVEAKLDALCAAWEVQVPR